MEDNKPQVNVGKKKEYKKIIIILTLVLIIASVGLAVSFVFNKKSEKPNVATVQTIEEIISKVENANKEKAQTVNSVADLSKLSKEDQASVGLIVIQQNSETNKQLSLEVANYLSKEGDSKLEALALAYRLESDSAKKQQIVNQINSVAIEQKLINPGETLPARFYDGTEGGLQ